MLLTSWSRLIYNSNGKISKHSKRIKPINKFQCDECSSIWEESSKKSHRFNKWGKHLCHTCIIIESKKRLVEAGSKFLSNRTQEERQKHGRIGGTASALSPNKDYHSFSIDRWNKMTEEEKQKQVQTAAQGLQTKLKDDNFKTKHFQKIFKNSKIGYISKGQQEVFNSLIEHKIDGFVLDGLISSLKVDLINFDKKIAIEYNGDFYHCNPKMWSPNQYNKCIKMFACEKWNADNRRKRFLMKLGYKVIIIWESGWKNDKNKYIKRIKDMIGE